MSFLSSLFGTSRPDDTQKAQILRDDGVRAMQMGEIPYSVKCLKASLELRPDASTEGLLAEALLRAGETAEALPILEKFAQQPDCSPLLRHTLARTYGRLEMYDKEKETAQALLDANAEDADALFLCAEAAFALNDPFTAVASLTRCLQICEENLEARALRCRVLAAMQQWKEALEDANALATAEPENETFAHLRADLLAKTGRTNEAIETYEQLRALNPFDREAVLRLGELYVAGSLFDKALALYDEAIDLDPTFAEAWRCRGGVRHHLHDEAGAADDLKHALELAPANEVVPDGEYSNVENAMNDRYRSLNPYGF